MKHFVTFFMGLGTLIMSPVFAGEIAIPNTSLKINFVSIPPGSFVMGKPGAYCADATPVEMTASYEIMQYELSQEEYFAIMGENPSLISEQFACPGLGQFVTYNVGHGRKVGVCRNLPVESMTYLKAVEFSDKLTQRINDGYIYRLPTEVEWEYAARAGTTTDFWYGDDYRYGMDVHRDESSAYQGRGHYTLAVGYGVSNPWNLYNMHGNVSEYMSGDFTCTSHEAPVPGYRGVRGGDFFNQPWLGKVWQRDNQPEWLASSGIGIRLVRVKH